MAIWANALLFFLVTNPIGNTPTILALVKDYPFEKQKKILLREGVFSLLIALFFQYFGEFFLDIIHAESYALTLCGGILLLIVALRMIFPTKSEQQENKLKQEPFIVPIATPLLTGAGVMSIIMIKAKLVQNNFEITAALLIAFSGVIGILAIAPYLQKILGRRGLDALEQIMGMILALIAVEMLVKGSFIFTKTLALSSH